MSTLTITAKGGPSLSIAEMDKIAAKGWTGKR